MAIINTLIYMYSTRPKHKMTKTKRRFTALAVVLMGLSTLTLAQKSGLAADPFQDFYNRNCVPEAQKSGLTKSEAEQGCTCTVNSLKNKYTTREFNDLLAAYRGGSANAKRTLTSYGEACFDKILDDLLFGN